MARSKVVYYGTTLMDITDTTAVASDVAVGKYFYTADGVKTEGTSAGGSTPTPTPVVHDTGVVFYDYDGTVVQTYTPTEFAALSAMPANPSHTGLTAHGWNWSLADAKAYVAKYGSLNIGQMYTTSDGRTRLYIHIDPSTPESRMTFYVRFTSSVANNVTIDWGDGTTETNGSTAARNYPHTYTTTGDFVITLTVNNGTISFVGTSGSTGYSIYGSRDINNYHNRGRIRKVEIGDNVTSIGTYAFQQCYSLTSITIPDGVTSIGTYVFQNCYSLTSLTIPRGVTSVNDDTFDSCYSLTSINIPDGVTSIGTYVFRYCYSLTSITIPDGVTSIGTNAFQQCHSMTSITIPDGVTSIKNSEFRSCSSMTSITIPDGVTSIETYAFQYCYSLTSINIPDNVTSIGNSAFNSCYGIGEYHFRPTTPPTLDGTSVFANIASDCVIYVPYSADHSILEAYQTATNWAKHAAKMVEEAPT